MLDRAVYLVKTFLMMLLGSRVVAMLLGYVLQASSDFSTIRVILQLSSSLICFTIFMAELGKIGWLLQ